MIRDALGRAELNVQPADVGWMYGENGREVEEKRQEERGLRGVAALVGTRLGVGSFVSWTLLLARINLPPPPLAPPLARHPAAVPSSAIPSPPLRPSLAKRGVRVSPRS